MNKVTLVDLFQSEIRYTILENRSPSPDELKLFKKYKDGSWTVIKILNKTELDILFLHQMAAILTNRLGLHGFMIHENHNAAILVLRERTTKKDKARILNLLMSN